jgi:polyisoprenoid-binding protein YceI
MNALKNLGAVLPLIILLGCSNPADNVPAAKTTSETNAPADTPGTASQGEEGRTYVFGPETSSIGFIGSKVTGSHQGGFKKFTGQLRAAKGRLTESGNKVIIETTSLWSDNEKLTGHLKSPDFFDAAQFPTATFVTTSITQQDTNSTVVGNFTLHGITKQIAFPAKIQVGDDQVELAAQFFINRFDFGMKYLGKADDLIRKEVVLKINVKAAPGKASW